MSCIEPQPEGDQKLVVGQRLRRERCQGGKLLDNIATMLLTGAQTPGQHARRVFEQASSFEQALKLFASGCLVDEGE